MCIIQGKWFEIEKCIFLLILIAGLSSSNPDNPCPHLFNYKFIGNEWIGVIQLDNIKVGQAISIYVKLTLPALLSTYIGSLDLLEGRQKAVESVFQGRPLLYKITFPSQNPLPKLTEIVINNVVVCRGPPDRNPQISTIQLYHNFYTKAFGSNNRVDVSSFDPFKDNFQFLTVTSSPPLQENLEFESHNDFSVSGSHPIFSNEKPGPSNSDQFGFVNPIQIPDVTKKPYFNIPGLQTTNKPYFNIPGFQTTNKPYFNIPELQTTNKPYFNIPGLQTTKQPFIQELQPTKQPEFPPRQPNTPPTSSINQSTKESNVVCGVAKVSAVTQFVVNGQPTNKGEWPWLAAIFINNGLNRTFQCGGTLLTSKVTITASHCFFREGQNSVMSSSDVFTALGRYDINNWADAGSEFLPTERIEFPPNFIRTDTFEMDIAMVIHRRPISFEEYPLIRPICLWSGSSNSLEIEGRMGTVVGWGEDEHGNRPSPEPKKVQVGIVSRKACIRGSTQLEAVTTSANFCAGERDGRGPCSGDSGSGLVIFNNNHWELRGIVAGTVQGGVIKGNQLCKLDEYVVYVDVVAYKDWILQMIAI